MDERDDGWTADGRMHQGEAERTSIFGVDELLLHQLAHLKAEDEYWAEPILNLFNDLSSIALPSFLRRTPFLTLERAVRTKTDCRLSPPTVEPVHKSLRGKGRGGMYMGGMNSVRGHRS